MSSTTDISAPGADLSVPARRYIVSSGYSMPQVHYAHSTDRSGLSALLFSLFFFYLESRGLIILKFRLIEDIEEEFETKHARYEKARTAAVSHLQYFVSGSNTLLLI